MNKLKKTGECLQCGDCCRSIRITAVLGHTLQQHKSFEDMKLYYKYHQVTVVGFDEETDLLFLEIPMKCTQWDPHQGCLVHHTPEKKPLLCHLYPTEPDDSPQCGYQFIPDEI